MGRLVPPMATDATRLPDQSGRDVASRTDAFPRRGSAAARTDQRSRLLQAMVAVVAQDGYPGTKIGDVSRRAGVSRATFYEQFPNKEECLLAANREQAERLGSELTLAVTRGEPGRATHSALIALVEFAAREPIAFDVLMHEPMLAGPPARDERDRLLGSLAHTIEQALQQAPAGAPVFDMSVKMLLDGTIRLLGLCMRRDGVMPPRLQTDLMAWADSYMVSPGPPRWRELVPNPALLAIQSDSTGGPTPHLSLPKGRHRLGPEVVRSVQRERIAYATAEAIRLKGYANITVADIVATAGLSRDVFYAQFHDKRQAFEGTVQLVFERLLAALAGAFFGSPGPWPEQLWEAGHAFVRFLENDPSLANFLDVGTYAPPPIIERVHEFVLAFTVFVESGNSRRPESAQVSRLISEAIVCSVLEIVNFHVRHDRVADLRGLIPNITYMVYAPFMGSDAACEFVDAKVEAAAAHSASPSQPRAGMA
jgi:AcrR family transcriptional regulator